MTTYYVATRARYVVVEADDETQAHELGCVALHEQYADVWERLGKDAPIAVHMVRRATDDEIKLAIWHREMVAREEPM